jgi:leader peptidase (prepilin peptidase)/N-methyltransferase
MLSSIIGSFVGLTTIALGKRAWSTRLPYGPYIAMGAVICVFWGDDIARLWGWWMVGRFR